MDKKIHMDEFQKKNLFEQALWETKYIRNENGVTITKISLSITDGKIGYKVFISNRNVWDNYFPINYL
jgi:hypothetical protein